MDRIYVMWKRVKKKKGVVIDIEYKGEEKMGGEGLKG